MLKRITDSILQVVMNGAAVDEAGQGYEYSGQLIQPAGFEGLLTVLRFQNLSESLIFEGASRPACHLVSMKVPSYRLRSNNGSCYRTND
jgi:hypothetical protein